MPAEIIAPEPTPRAYAARSGPSALAGASGEKLALTPVPTEEQAEVQVEVRRSARRRRTVSAYRDGERIVVLIPQRFSRAQEQEYVQKMVGQLSATETRRRARNASRTSDAALADRARSLSDRYLNSAAYPSTIRWVPAMRTRWASCTPIDASIRISSRLREMPDWVLDYVIVHELAHLQVPGHGADFWALVERYPRTERARGYLDGVSAAAHLNIDADEAASDVQA